MKSLNKKDIKILCLTRAADLELTLSDNVQIEIIISSVGYESYNFSINNKNYIGMGSGYIEVFDR